MSLYEERAARNEVLFREVNEEVEALAERFDHDRSEPLRLVCECANAECSEMIFVSTQVYEDVRSHSRRFVVRPGHETTAVEQIVLVTADFAVVEKDTPTAARVAERHDPRK